MDTCHCPTCDEPDPHCEHHVNLATTSCEACDFYADMIREEQEAEDRLRNEINDDIEQDRPRTQGRWK